MKRLKQIWNLRRLVAIPPGAPRLNLLAALIGGSAFGILLLTFHAKPAGAGLDHSALSTPQLSMTAQPAALHADAGGQALGSLSLEELNTRVRNAIHGSRLALQLHVALLEVGKHRLEHFPDYTATFLKQERVDGNDLQELQTIQLKLRHDPFSVYMKWIEGGDVGRQVLLVEGQYKDLMQVKLGGKKGTLLPIVQLDPAGATAMRESRHPATQMGLLHLTEQLLNFRKRDCTLKQGVRWEMVPDQEFMDRVCDCWVVQYDDREVEPVYRKTITYIDRELSLPVCVKNFGWPAEGDEATDAVALDEATLIEYYGYSDIQVEHRLSDADFDKANAEYKFRR